jgi:predicted metal-dependent hydrolase
MEEQGLKPERFAEFLKVTAFSGKYSMENSLVKIFNRLQPRLGNKMALSLTAALEHYTAILADAFFHEPFATNKFIAPQMLELLHWHACEEIEHKAVAFDVLKEVDDSYIIRVSGMGLATLMLWGYIASGQVYFLSQDKDKSIIRMPIESFILFKTVVFGEIGKTLSKRLLDYFKKDFHPNDTDDRYLVEAFFKDKAYA